MKIFLVSYPDGSANQTKSDSLLELLWIFPPIITSNIVGVFLTSGNWSSFSKQFNVPLKNEPKLKINVIFLKPVS